MARLHGKRWLASATDPSGARLRPTFPTQAEAERWEEEARNAIAEGRPIPHPATGKSKGRQGARNLDKGTLRTGRSQGSGGQLSGPRIPEQSGGFGFQIVPPPLCNLEITRPQVHQIEAAHAKRLLAGDRNSPAKPPAVMLQHQQPPPSVLAFPRHAKPVLTSHSDQLLGP